MRATRWFGLLCLAISVLAFVAQVGRAEIPAGPDVPTNRDFITAKKAHFTRVILEPYIARRPIDKSGSAANDPVESYLTLWIEHCADGFTSQNNDSLEYKGRQIADVGCDDPIFLYCHGRALEEQGSLEESLDFLKRARDDLPDSAYPIDYQCWAADHVSAVLKRLGRNKEAEPVESQAVELAIATITNGDFHSDEQRLLFDAIQPMVKNYPDEGVGRLLDAITGNTAVSLWLQHMVAGEHEITLAWKARGSGWASEVTQEGQKGFKEHIEKARDHLSAAWELDKQAPEPAAEMITVAMSGADPVGEAPRLWFDRAVGAQLDYIPAYNNFENSLLPRWGGSHEAMYLFGRECLKTKRFDTFVPYHHLATFQRILNDTGSDFDIFLAPGVYEDVIELADGYINQEKDWSRHWYRSLKVAAAARSGRWEDARRFLDELDGQPDNDAFYRLGLKQRMTIGEIHAHAGEIADDTAEAERLINAGQFGDAKDKYAAILERAGGQGPRGEFIKKRIADIEFKQLFVAGQWARIPIDAKLSAWRALHGIWTVDENGRLVGKSQNDSPMIIAADKLGTRFEVRGTVDFVTATPGSDYKVGIYFGRETGWVRNSFTLSKQDHSAAIVSDSGSVQKKDFPVGESNKFRIERWNDRLSAYIDEMPLFNHVEIESVGSPGGEILALGGSDSRRGFTVRYADVELRQLNEEPPDMQQAEKDEKTKEDEESAGHSTAKNGEESATTPTDKTDQKAN
jgi:tetratricopeptide (TPR) repeat protein